LIDNKFIKFILSFLIICLLCIGIIWLFDYKFNGVIKEWFYNLFYLDINYSEDAKIGVIYKSWSEIKLFFIYAFVATVLIIIVFMSIALLYAGYKTKKEITFIKEIVQAYMKSDTEELTLPKKYSEIENQLIKIKSISQKHQQLMQMEAQQKNDLITYLAHDLKTPLASVIGYLCLLDEAQDMPMKQKVKYTEIALVKAYRLEELINEFFEITRFNLQSMVLNKSKIKLAFMLEQLADEFYPMLVPQNKQVAIQASDNLSLIGDADKLARVFNNILKNAIAYSYYNSVIDIVAVQQADMVNITFTNHGDPIPSQKLSTIFEKFYRLDSARSTDTGGAGLGLAIAKEIVTAHNGTISVDSSLEKTIFTVEIPLV